MKTCFKCNTEKSLTDFYKHPQMADGHVNKCKECNKKDVRENYQANHDYFVEYDRKRTHLPHRVEARKYSANGKIGLYCTIPEGHAARNNDSASKCYDLRNPKKYKAKNATYCAIKSGKLIRQPCEVCSTTENIHAHHPSYDKPLDVMWLCQTHHLEWHRKHGAIV